MKARIIIVFVMVILTSIKPFNSFAQKRNISEDSGSNSVPGNVSIESIIEEIKNENKHLTEKNAELEYRLNQIEKDLALKSGTGSLEIGISTARLEQNTPNPFKEKTSIKFYIPSNVSSAFIKIYSLFGTELLSFPIATKGLNQIEFSGKTLSAGTFTYILFVDEKAVDTKQMVLTR